MNAVRASMSWFRMTWATQPVLVLSCVLGALGEAVVTRWALYRIPPSVGPLFVAFGPGSAKGEQERLNWPTHYKSSELSVH